MAATILTKDAVTLYDIETRTIWNTMSVAAGQADVNACYEIGDTVQEYETIDRAGNPLRVVYQVDAVRLYSGPDQGGVYEFPLPALHTVTRTPEHPDYTDLGTEDTPGEDYYLHLDGNRIGGTYYCGAHNVPDGQRWASWGIAGYSMRHRTREDAEQVQVAFYLAHPDQAATFLADQPEEPTTATEAAPELKPLPMTWDQALEEAKDKGVGKCSDPAVMAQFCQADIHTLIGAVSAQLVWEGAQKKGLTFLEFGRLCGRDPMAVEALQWL
jgi:hypothetical protein